MVRDSDRKWTYRVMRGHAYEEEVDDAHLPYRAVLTGLRERSSSHGFPQISNAPGAQYTRYTEHRILSYSL